VCRFRLGNRVFRHLAIPEKHVTLWRKHGGLQRCRTTDNSTGISRRYKGASQPAVPLECLVVV
jgi:hypothetical protein